MKSTILNLLFVMGTFFGIPLVVAEYKLQQNYVNSSYDVNSAINAKISPICSKIDSIDLLKQKLHEDVKRSLEFNNQILQAKKQEIAHVSSAVDSVYLGGDYEIDHIDTISIIK